MVPRNSGLTGYQEKLNNKMKEISEQMDERKINLDFHICHFGEADPIFLRAIRESTSGKLSD